MPTRKLPRSVPVMIPVAADSRGEAIDNETSPEQKALLAGPGAGDAILARPQRATKDANSIEFQPSMLHDPSGRSAVNPDYYDAPGAQRGTLAGAAGCTDATKLVGDLVTGEAFLVQGNATEAFKPTKFGGPDILVAGADWEATPAALEVRETIDDLPDNTQGQTTPFSR
jgi:hypothetical protein